MDLIHLLPDSVANQIAAGEVVQRPASVLKELVENSIDAGATSVEVVVKDAGRTLLQVVDNGKGMSDTDARMAFERHATSKISDAADLFNLTTMGFRGEALASIAAVAHVEMRTRRPDDELGTLLEIAGSQYERQECVQCAAGTSIAVKNLFFNTPARRRFLKTNPTELRNLLTEFYRIVLVNPRVAFTLTSDDTQLYQLAAGTTKQRIDALYAQQGKKDFARQLLTVETETSIVNIRGYVGKPEAAQKTAQQYFFVNGRYMRHPYFHKAVMAAYEGMLQRELNPHYFLYFELDPASIDVNIHPTKTEIKFADEQTIWPLLMAAVKETLGKFNIAPRIDFDQEGAIEIPVPSQADLSRVRPPQTGFNPAYNPFSSSSPKRRADHWQQLYESFEKGGDRSNQSNQANRSNPLGADLTDLTDLTDSNSQQEALLFDNRHEADDVFQVARKYIVTNTKSGMLLIDQHRAHVRILFDRFSRQMEARAGVSQQLLFPEVWDVTPDEARLVDGMMEELQYLGFDLSRFGPHSYSVAGVPSDLTASPQRALTDLLQAATEQTSGSLPTREERLAASLAEHAAINYGQTLKPEEMQQLLERLFACPAHAVTPDGKPTMTLLTTDEIDKRFR